jgi:hypothetical protein
MSRDDVQPKLLPGSLRNHLKGVVRQRARSASRRGSFRP